MYETHIYTTDVPLPALASFPQGADIKGCFEWFLLLLIIKGTMRESNIYLNKQRFLVFVKMR